MRKNKNKIYLKDQFVMTAEEINFLTEVLPANLPETHLTQKQKDEVSRLYYKYCSKIDNQRGGETLCEIEQREKWPSGPRVKRHEAQRICLGFITNEQRFNGMTAERAAFHFWIDLQSREANKKVVFNIWEVPAVY